MMSSIVHNLIASGKSLTDVSSEARFKDIPNLPEGFKMAGTEVLSGKNWADVS